MKVYFEDGVLTATQQLKLGCDYLVNAASGYSANVQFLDQISMTEPDASVYTNSLVAISGSYCWNDILKVQELYLRSRKNGEFIRIDELTGSKFRLSQNLLGMYRSGALSD